MNTKDGKFQLNSVDDEYEYEGKPSIVSYSFCMRHQGPFHSTRATTKMSWATISRRSRKGKIQGKEEEERKEKDKKRKTNRQEVLMQQTCYHIYSSFFFIYEKYEVWKYVSIFPKFNQKSPPNNGHIFKRSYIYLGLEVSTSPGWVVVVPSLYLTVYGMRPFFSGEMVPGVIPLQGFQGHIPALGKGKTCSKVPFLVGYVFFFSQEFFTLKSRFFFFG